MKLNSILVIDDSKYDLFIATEMLSDYCDVKEVVCVDSAQKGIKYLQSKENTPEELPEYIFLDIKMPLMDGFDFLNLYNQLSDTIKKHCKIYMLSSSLDPTDIAKAKNNNNVIDFIEKPLSEEHIGKLFN
jgi:CheY-like chemotaxis protein